MKLHLLRVSILGLTVGVPAAALAQSDIPVEYLRPLNNSVSVGVHVMSHGVSVKFGQLGGTPYNLPYLDLTAPLADRTYNNGTVKLDVRRGEEYQTVPGTGAIVTDSNGVQQLLPVVNGRYQAISYTAVVDANGAAVLDPSENQTYTTNIIGDRLAYADGQTRYWSYNSATQVQNGQIAMSNYATDTLGADVSGKGGSSAGFELTVAHTLGKIGEHLEWGVSFSFGLGDINVKSSGTIPVLLLAKTDYFSLNGAAAPVSGDAANPYPYIAPTYVDGVSPTTPIPDGATTAPSTSNFLETTTPISQNPSKGSGLVTTSTGTANGHWQIKGSYYLLRLGPTVRYTISPRFALSGGAGAAVAFAGTRYRSEETYTLPDVSGNLGFGWETAAQQKLVPGFYGEFNGEFWVTQRTGFYAGVTYEKLGSYNQQGFFRHTAKIDLGSGSGFRFGLITRF